MEPTKTATENSGKTSPKKRRGLKIAAAIVIGILVLLLITVAVAPMIVSSSGGTRFLLSKINRSVDGRVGMDNLSVGWFSGVKLTNLTFESGDGATQVKVDRISTQPNYAALIGGRVDMGQTIIDKPHVYLKLTQAQTQTPAPTDGGKTPPAPQGKPDTTFMLPVQLMDLKVMQGDATIELVDAENRVQRVSFKNIASAVVLNEPGKQSQLDLSLDVANGHAAGSIKAQGAVTPPAKGWTLEDTDGTFTVSISKLDLQTLRPLLALAGQDVQVGGVLNADANVQIRKGNVETATADATVTNFSQGAGDQKVTFNEPVTLTAAAGMKDNTVRIDKLNVKMPFCDVTCSGGTETLDYAVNANLAQTQAFVKQFSDLGGYGMAGQLNVSGTLNLGKNIVATAGKGTVKNLLLSKDGVQAPQTNVTLDYDLTADNQKQVLTITSAALSMLPGTVSVRNAALPMGDSQAAIPPMTLTAQTNLDMAKAWPYAQILGGAPADITLAGLLDAAVSVASKNDIVQVKTDKATVKKLRVAKPDGEPFVQDEVRLTADVSLNMAKQSIGINAFDMQSASGETLIKIIKGKVDQSSAEGVSTMNAEIEAEYDLKAVSNLASPFLPEGLNIEGRRKDRFVFSSRWPDDKPEQKMANLSGSGNLGFSKATYQGLNFGPTEVKLNVKQGHATVDMPDADVNGGKVRFAGDINLTEEPMMLRLRTPSQVVENVKIDDIISAQLLQYLNPVFAQGTGVSGQANLSCSTLTIPLGGGEPKDINLAGKVSLTDVRLNSPLLGVVKSALRTEGLNLFSIPASDFTVKDGLVRYDDMPMMFGKDFALRFSGAIGLDRSLQMSVKVPVQDKTYVVPLTGTLDKQELDVGKLALSNIAEQIPIKDEKTKEAVEKGLELFEGIFKNR